MLKEANKAQYNTVIVSVESYAITYKFSWVRMSQTHALFPLQ